MEGTLEETRAPVKPDTDSFWTMDPNFPRFEQK
jgi:hypothetical protein